MQPPARVVGPRLPVIEVEVLDAAGRRATSASGPVTLEVLAGDGLRLPLRRTVHAAQGVARFTGVEVDAPGNGLQLLTSGGGHTAAKSRAFDLLPRRRHAILMIADGWGYKQIEATRAYTRRDPVYASGFVEFAMATWDDDTRQFHQGVGYDPTGFWQRFSYGTAAACDSASSATAMYTGQKTERGNITVSLGDKDRLGSLGELAGAAGLGTGAITTVPVSHATPGAWIAHNDDRANGFAIADEGFWGDPNTTGTLAVHKAYGGGRGPTRPGQDLLLGGGHPGWNQDAYVNALILKKLAAESGQPGKWTLVERKKGHTDAAERLFRAALDPRTSRLAGMFGGPLGNIDFRLASGAGHDPENPTLAAMTRAALAFLGRKERGFVLMVEGGAVDWAGHIGDLDRCIGEMIGFDEAVAEVVAWIEDPRNDASWDNTLLIVTGDHETGFLTRAPGVFPNRPLGEISPRTLALEKLVSSTKLRASWEDGDQDGEIDQGESTYWAWNTIGHSNSLIPLYARGLGADEFRQRVVRRDPVRGLYVDNTSIFHVVRGLIERN